MSTYTGVTKFKYTVQYIWAQPVHLSRGNGPGGNHLGSFCRHQDVHLNETGRKHRPHYARKTTDTLGGPRDIMYGKVTGSQSLQTSWKRLKTELFQRSVTQYFVMSP